MKQKLGISNADSASTIKKISCTICHRLAFDLISFRITLTQAHFNFTIILFYKAVILKDSRILKLQTTNN